MDARNKRFYDALAVACPLAPTPAHSSRRATLGTLRVASATAAVVPSSQAIVSRICAGCDGVFGLRQPRCVSQGTAPLSAFMVYGGLPRLVLHVARRCHVALRYICTPSHRQIISLSRCGARCRVRCDVECWDRHRCRGCQFAHGARCRACA